MVEDQVDISVIVLTYNQKMYVTQALESVISQNFYGKWELIVADDCSTDGTFEIVQLVLRKFPKFVTLYSNEFNLGLAKNYEKAILSAQGKYIAYLEGDDYWTDTSKLQKQFDFLESNVDCVLAFHDFVWVDKDGKIISESNLNNSNLKRRRSKKDMVTGCLIHQNTIMFRNVILNFPLGFFKAKNHDTFLIGYLSNWGVAGYVFCLPLCYRIHSGTLWSSLSSFQRQRNSINTFFQLLWHVELKYSPFILWKILQKIRYIVLLRLEIGYKG